MGEMTPVGQVQAHNTPVGLHKSGVHCKVGLNRKFDGQIMILMTFWGRSTQLTNLCLQVLTVHGNELRLFLGQGIPPYPDD